MFDIVHRVGIKAPVATVYAALSTIDGVSAWWTEDTRGVSAPGGNIEFTFLTPAGEKVGSIGVDVMALDPGKQVQWRVTSGPEEWIGTDLKFRLRQDGDYAIVMFSHENWREAVEFTAHCSTKWATFLLSLKDLVETGKGRPAPHDLRIGDFH